MVFDMGAGTLDVSVLEIDDGFFEVIGTGGDIHLGGMDMDTALANHITSEFRKQSGSNGMIDDVLSLEINRLVRELRLNSQKKNKFR